MRYCSTSTGPWPILRPISSRVLNHLLIAEGLPRMPYAIARNEVSNGASGLLRLGFGEQQTEAELETRRARFLADYAENICVESRLFIDIDSISHQEDDIRWGIVTNKPEALTLPLLLQLGIHDLPGCIISGDRLPQRKPHPAPLRLAAAQLEVAPARCVYVGDAPRDIEAGRAAGMATIAAAYGYIRPRQDPRSWGADLVHPAAARACGRAACLERASRAMTALLGMAAPLYRRSRYRRLVDRARYRAARAEPVAARARRPRESRARARVCARTRDRTAELRVRRAREPAVPKPLGNVLEARARNPERANGAGEGRPLRARAGNRRPRASDPRRASAHRVASSKSSTKPRRETHGSISGAARGDGSESARALAPRPATS